VGLRQFKAMVRKDIVSELRSRETVVSMFLFVVLAMVVFHYAFTVPGGGDLSFYTGGMLWVVFVFGALLGSTARSPTKRTKAVSTACCSARSTG